MRGARWLLLAAIIAILGTVGVTYVYQKNLLLSAAPPKPAPLDLALRAAAEDWQVTQTAQGRPAFHIRAKNFEQDKESGQLNLKGVELKLFHGDTGSRFDLIRSAEAKFYQAEGVMYSEGEVEIILGVPADGQPSNRLVSIKSSGVTFESATGRASTDRLATFLFENGSGSAVGTSYDPTTRDLHMRSQVRLDWKAPEPNSKPMTIEAGELIYKETMAVILLTPWARLTRENSTIEGAETVVTLLDGAIHKVESKNARGTDRFPNRQLEYGADQLYVEFAGGEVRTVTGQPKARMVSKTDSSETTVVADRVDLAFDPSQENALTAAIARGDGTVTAKPVAAKGIPPPTRILRSEFIKLSMREGGREIEAVQTEAPGQVEFLPNHPSQRRREMDGERIWIAYGPGNRVKSFRSVNVATRTEPPAAEAKTRGPLRTWSDNFLAGFDPVTGEMQRIEQWDNFRYEEGARKARAVRAVLEAKTGRIVLEQSARVWDDTGATAADVIHLDQKTGAFEARGNVASSRIPDKKKPSTGMLSGDDPLQATAEQMFSESRNRHIRYLGKALMWQGPNRLRGDQIEIDREAGRLTAQGSVSTQLVESKAASGSFTNVQAARLVYTEDDKVAHYTGGVTLIRGDTRVKSEELRAYFVEDDSGSRLEKAMADGRVEIQQTIPDRTRTGTGEHGEYYVAEEKVILRGGAPELVDSLRGVARGKELIWFAKDDRLLVNGEADGRATSRLRRKSSR
ncbi:MAG: LPS export ABC transporter periplasmic protein LptC [Bryobacteraceae bacterium]